MFGILNSCIIPTAMTVGRVTQPAVLPCRHLDASFVPMEPPQVLILMPTTTDEYGNSQPGTAYELHCIDTGGVILKEDPVLYAFVWIGMIAVIGLGIVALLALVLAAPAGVFITRFLNQRQELNTSTNVEYKTNL